MEPKTKRKAEDRLAGELKGELAAFLNTLVARKDLAPKSQRRYRGLLLIYQQFLDANGASPCPEATEKFLLSLKAGGYAPATLKLYKGVLTALHQWRGELAPDFKVKVPKKQAPYVPAETVEGIIKLAAPEHYLPLVLMADAGLRLSEALSLKVEDCFPSQGILRVALGKGRKGRTIPLTRRLRAALAQAIAGKRPQDPLVGMTAKVVYGAVKKYGRLAGAPEIHPHSMRHGFAERLREKGADIRQIQELMGHSGISTTEVYLAIQPRHLEAAIRMLDGPEATPPPAQGPVYTPQQVGAEVRFYAVLAQGGAKGPGCPGKL